MGRGVDIVGIRWSGNLCGWWGRDNFSIERRGLEMILDFVSVTDCGAGMDAEEHPPHPSRPIDIPNLNLHGPLNGSAIKQMLGLDV